MLFENNSNETSPVYLAHESFVTFFHTYVCAKVNELEWHTKCEFAKTTNDCRIEERLLNYTSFIFCGSEPYTEYIAKVALIVWVVYLFFVMALVADKFFTPTLTSIALNLKLSESLAGVTLLAFGNGASDIFSSIYDPDIDSEMMINELFGGGLFVICVIGGTLAILKPFYVVSHTFLRDAFFLVFGVITVLFCLDDKFYVQSEAVFTLVLYLVYIIIVIISHVVQKKMEERRTALGSSKKSNDLLEKISSNASKDRNSSEPIGTLSLIMKVYEIFSVLIKIPTEFLLKLTIPQYDVTAERNGWTKLLNLGNIFVTPQVLLVIFLGYGQKFRGIPAPIIALSISCGFCMLVYFTSKSTEPPPYHIIFGLISFFGCIIILFGISSEIISVLNTLSVISNFTHGFVGLTVIGIGKNISDVVANVSLARQGYQKMSFAACFGGVIFNILMTMGTTFLSKSAEQHSYSRQGTLGLNCCFYLILVTVFISLAFFLSGFEARKSIGIYLLVVYGIFILHAVLIETQVLHGYGTDHTRL